MNVLAVVLAAIAVVVLLAVHFGVPRRWATLSLGLVFFVFAVSVQFIWQAHQWVIH